MKSVEYEQRKAEALTYAILREAVVLAGLFERYGGGDWSVASFRQFSGTLRSLHAPKHFETEEEALMLLQVGRAFRAVLAPKQDGIWPPMNMEDLESSSWVRVQGAVRLGFAKLYELARVDQDTFEDVVMHGTLDTRNGGRVSTLDLAKMVLSEFTERLHVNALVS